MNLHMLAYKQIDEKKQVVRSVYYKIYKYKKAENCKKNQTIWLKKSINFLCIMYNLWVKIKPNKKTAGDVRFCKF